MPNQSSKFFDSTLMEILHYQSFPAMLPFVGKDYVLANHSKLLIFGESFYFPKQSTLHNEPSKWYSSRQESLESNEVEHINCRGLLECDWGLRGHRIYRELNSCLAELDLPSPDRPISHICFTNTFMRPARHRGTFKGCCVDRDIELSNEVVARVIKALDPDLVIFASKYAWDMVGGNVAKRFSGITFDFVYHPARHYWWNGRSNPKSHEHGRKKFLSLLKNKWAVKG